MAEDTNAEYYSHLWNKENKRRIDPKKAKSKKAMFLRNLLISAIENLRRLHYKGVNSRHRPLRGR